MTDRIDFVLHLLPTLLFGLPGQRPGGLLLTVGLAIVANLAALLLALLLCVCGSAQHPFIKWSVNTYIKAFQRLPLLVLLLLVYQGVGQMHGLLAIGPRAAALVALTLYGAAYQADIVRAGLQAVPSALPESARVLGDKPWHVYCAVELRYAARLMLPAVVGQAISLFKDTSIVVVLGIGDLMTTARLILGSSSDNQSKWVTVYLVVGALYFAVAFAISLSARAWERRQHRRIPIAYFTAV